MFNTEAISLISSLPNSNEQLSDVMLAHLRAEIKRYLLADFSRR
jgi:hypothetical protein